MMPPPPPPPNVYPCLDWVPQGVARRKPDRLRLTSEELKTVISGAKAKALESRRRLGQAVREESSGQRNDGGNDEDAEMSDNDRHGMADTNNEDDAIMNEYGLGDYDEEDEDGTNNNLLRGETEEASENENDDDTAATRGATRSLASDIAGLTYHASNDEDPYLQQGNISNDDDDDDDDEELIIKPTDNLIVAGHVSKDESSIEVYVYDNEHDSFYLHHDIIQADYPCCVRWVGHVRNQTKNIAAAGYMNPDIFLWDLDVVDVLEPLEVLTGHTDAVIDICWNSQVKNVIASGSADKHVILWNLDECKSISNIKLSGKVSALEFGIYEQFLLLAGDLNRNVCVIDTRSGSVINKWQLTGEVERVRWVPIDHSKFLVSDDQGYVYCFDIRHSENNQPVVKFHAHQISVTGLEFSPKCDDMLVTASADDTVKVWDTRATFRGVKNTGIEPTLVKEISDLKVGNILSLRMCPNSLARIAVGGDSKCNSFTTYDLTCEKEVVPARFAEKFSVVQAKSGESAKLECNATGDQPLTVNWFKEETKLSKRGGENFEIYETMNNGGLNSVLVIRTINRADGLTYKCVGENEYGNDERLIKLMVVEVPSRPLNVRVKDAWSRSASLVWSTPFAGNSPITNYIIQYWRKNNNEAGQNAQNHRRQEFTVSGTQTSALITNLMPSLTYEASVIAENQVGKSEPSENVAINTGEDEPTAAPSDVNVEARGPSTIRVAWKVPPSETWNGKLLGFYVGFRPRDDQVLQLNRLVSTAYSYRTIDYIKGQQMFETFITNLAKGHEYEVLVKAFNGVGSGPESHLMTVRTFDGDLPAAPALFAHQTTQSSIALRWTYPSRAQSTANTIKRYVLYYQRQGDDSWLEIAIPIEEKLRSSGGSQHNQQDNSPSGFSISESGTTSYVLTGLDSGFAYKIYVVAVNNFGMGDPSNIVTTKTEAISGMNEVLRSSSHSNEMNVLEMNRQAQLFLVVPIICTVIVVVVIAMAVLYCGRRMPNSGAQHVLSNHHPQQQQQQQQPSSQAGTWGPEGPIQVGQRYVEFDKGGILKTNGSLLTGTHNSDQMSSGQQGYPLPYGTMPMNSVVISDQKSWDQQSNVPLKPLVTHIYDSPINN